MNKGSTAGEDDDEIMDSDVDNTYTKIELIKSLHMKGAVEAVCFVNGGDKLCINKRDTSYMYLAYFDPKDENEHIFAEHTNDFLDFFSAMTISNLVLSHTIDTLLDSN